MRGLALLVLTCSIPAFSWGPEGHRLVARIAQQMLMPSTAERVQATLAPGETIASIASWADEERKIRPETEPWHFIDIPIESAGLDMERDCPPKGCVLSKIVEFRKRWHDPSVSPAQRREALMFLVHFVGDMHQPLHCANNHDRGGNDVKVEFEGQSMNLHHLWDSALLDRMPGEDALLTTLSRGITSEQRSNWSSGTVEDWANESFQAARRVVYGEMPEVRQGEGLRLGAEYEQRGDAVVEQQLQKAAVRMAAILNETP